VPFQPLSADLIIARLFDEPELELSPALFGGADIVDLPEAIAAREAAQRPALTGDATVLPFPAAGEKPAEEGTSPAAIGLKAEGQRASGGA
jgi:hypothetical protein